MTNTMPKNYVELILQDENLTQEEKIKRINFVYENYRQKLDEDLRNYLIKIWSGAALEIGSAALPFSGTGKLGAMAGQKLLQKAIGKKLAQEIGSGAASGLASGGMFGAGRGMIEDKNPLMTGLQDAGLGMFAGGGIGAINGKILLNNHLKQLNEILDKRKDWGIAFQKASGNTEKAINTLLEHKKGFVPDAFNKKGIGKTDLVWGQDGELGYGMAHFIEKRQKQKIDIDEFLKSLPETIDNGIVTQNDPRHPNNKYIEDITNKIAIATDWYGKPRNWIVTAHRQNKSAAKRLTVSAPTSNLSPEKGANSISRLAADKSIINDNSKKVNPAPMIIPPQILQNPQEDNQPSFLLEGGVEMNVDKDGNPIFTPQEIGEMSREDFEKNLPIIEQQLKDGLIKPETQKLNYSGYLNPISGEDKIFTREAISQMTGDEYSGNESAIMAQLNSIGIPYESDLELASMNGGGLIYVRPYTRSDGTEVRGYWRSA